MRQEDRWIDFLSGQDLDHRGRTIERIWAFSDRALEDSHDYIQWLFPLREASPVNPYAPRLDDFRVGVVRGDPALHARMITSLDVMLRFYGFVRRVDEGGVSVVIDEDRFDRRTADWVRPMNHNFLRITRILRCLTEVGCEAEARAFHAALSIPIEVYPEVISERTQDFWRHAVEDALPTR